MPSKKPAKPGTKSTSTKPTPLRAELDQMANFARRMPELQNQYGASLAEIYPEVADQLRNIGMGNATQPEFVLDVLKRAIDDVALAAGPQGQPQAQNEPSVYEMGAGAMPRQDTLASRFGELNPIYDPAKGPVEARAAQYQPASPPLDAIWATPRGQAELRAAVARIIGSLNRSNAREADYVRDPANTISTDYGAGASRGTNTRHD